MEFSVIIPTYNRKSKIHLAIESALKQNITKTSIEILVIDDHSTDGTVDWLKQRYKTDFRVRVITNERAKGPAGARNTGILAARGKLIAFLDSDDIYLPGHLASVNRLLIQHPEVSVVFGRACYEQNGVEVDYMGPNFNSKVALAPCLFEDTEVYVFEDAFFKHVLEQGCYFNLSTVVMRASAARVLMNETLRIAEDFEFWVRLARNNRFACLKHPQIRYQLHNQNISFDEAINHAPILLRAYDIMLAYKQLTLEEQEIINRKQAEVLFDWAYRCSLRGYLLDAAKLHWRSAILGLRQRNFLAMLKLPLRGFRNRLFFYESSQ